MAKLKLDTNNIVTCILYVLIGLLLCILRMGMLGILLTVIGVLFIVYGIIDIIHKRTVPGIVEVVIGAVIIVCGWTIATWAIIVFGVLVAIKGVMDLINVIKGKKDTMSLVAAIVTIVVGVVLCIAPFAIGDIICIIVGVLFIVNGVLALFGKKLA